MTPPGASGTPPPTTIRRASHYRKRPRRPGGRPPYIPLYHIPWGGPSPATHSRHPVGAGHARPAALPLHPLYLLHRRGVLTPPGASGTPPPTTIRRASHYRKRPRRPGGRPPYIPLYHIPWGGPSPATHSRHPVGAGHARPAALPLYPLYPLHRREGS